MTDEVETKRIPYRPSMNRGLSQSRAEVTFSMPSPEHGSKLVGRVECGNLVAKVYQHADHPNFARTITFEREFLEDGKLKSSPRLTVGDLDTLRHLTGELRKMLRFPEDPVDRQLLEDSWARAEARRPKRTRITR